MRGEGGIRTPEGVSPYATSRRVPVTAGPSKDRGRTYRHALRPGSARSPQSLPAPDSNWDLPD